MRSDITDARASRLVALAGRGFDTYRIAERILEHLEPGATADYLTWSQLASRIRPTHPNASAIFSLAADLDAREPHFEQQAVAAPMNPLLEAQAQLFALLLTFTSSVRELARIAYAGDGDPARIYRTGAEAISGVARSLRQVADAHDEAAREFTRLADHQHQFGPDQYCQLCGIDGRV